GCPGGPGRRAGGRGGWGAGGPLSGPAGCRSRPGGPAAGAAGFDGVGFGAPLASPAEKTARPSAATAQAAAARAVQLRLEAAEPNVIMGNPLPVAGDVEREARHTNTAPVLPCPRASREAPRGSAGAEVKRELALHPGSP